MEEDKKELKNNVELFIESQQKIVEENRPVVKRKYDYAMLAVKRSVFERVNAVKQAEGMTASEVLDMLLTYKYG